MTTTAAVWPTATANRRGNLVLSHALLEIKAALRAPEFLAGAMLIPLLLYTMFGLSNDSTLPAGTPVRTFMLVSLAAYGVVSLSIFVLGEDVAKERGRGWIRTLHATGFPPSVHLTGKAISGVGHAAMVVLAMALLAAFGGGVELSAGRWLAFGATMLAGFVLSTPLGLAIAYLARPRTATVIANVIFLPLSFASGFFVPLSELPDAVGQLARFLPTTHFGQLAYRTVMPEEDIAFLTGIEGQAVWVHAAWVIGASILLAALAVWGAHREAVTRRG